MHAYTLSIGRNVGSEPMSARDWATFQRSIHALLPDAFTVAHGTGIWECTREETAIWQGNLPSEHLPTLRTALADLAAAYRQDAIGFIVCPANESYIPAIT